MGSCVENVCTKSYENLSILFQVTNDNVGNAFWRTFVHFNAYFVDLFSPGSAKADIR